MLTQQPACDLLVYRANPRAPMCVIFVGTIRKPSGSANLREWSRWWGDDFMIGLPFVGRYLAALCELANCYWFHLVHHFCDCAAHLWSVAQVVDHALD